MAGVETEVWHRSLNLKLRVFVDTQSYCMRSIALPRTVSRKSSGRHAEKKNSTFGSEPHHRKPCTWNPKTTDVIGGDVGELSQTWDFKQDMRLLTEMPLIRKKTPTELFEVWRLAALPLHA